MRFNKLGFIIMTLAAAGLLVFLFLVSRPWLAERYQTVQKIRVSAFSGLNLFSSLMSEIDKISNLMRENSALKDENIKILSQLASQAELTDQNNFLRGALNLNKSPEIKIIDARAFNLQF